MPIAPLTPEIRVGLGGPAEIAPVGEIAFLDRIALEDLLGELFLVVVTLQRQEGAAPSWTCAILSNLKEKVHEIRRPAADDLRFRLCSQSSIV